MNECVCFNSIYENYKLTDKDHVATPRWVVESIYEIINIHDFKNIWFPFNNYDSNFKLKADELKELLEKLQVAGIHTAIETNATSPRLIELVHYIDYLIMDFKHYDSLVLKQFTGMGNEGIKANFEAICAMGRQVHVRIPLINGFNADNPEGFAAYFASQDTQNAAFEFLPYHEYGKDKWKTPYMVQDGYISEETLQQFKEVFKEYGLNVIST